MLVLGWSQRAHCWFWGRPKGHSVFWKRPSKNPVLYVSLSSSLTFLSFRCMLHHTPPAPPPPPPPTMSYHFHSQLCPSTPPPPPPPDSYSNSVFSPGAASSFRDKSNSGGGPNGSILSNTVVQLRSREKSPQDGRVGRSYSITSSVRKSRNLDKNCTCCVCVCVCVCMCVYVCVCAACSCWL